MFPSFGPHQSCIILIKSTYWLLSPHHEFITVASAAKVAFLKMRFPEARKPGKKELRQGWSWCRVRNLDGGWSSRWSTRKSGEKDRNESKARAHGCAGSKRGMTPELAPCCGTASLQAAWLLTVPDHGLSLVALVIISAGERAVKAASTVQPPWGNYPN